MRLYYMKCTFHGVDLVILEFTETHYEHKQDRVALNYETMKMRW